MRKVKLFNLLPEISDDKGTADSPLLHLVDYKGKLDTDSLYVRAIASLSYAWVLCTPSDVANVSAFCNALIAFTVQQRAFGATWEALSSFHAELLRKVDEESEK